MKYSKENLEKYVKDCDTISDLVRKIKGCETISPSSINLVFFKETFNLSSIFNLIGYNYGNSILTS